MVLRGDWWASMLASLRGREGNPSVGEYGESTTTLFVGVDVPDME